jgi:hypothetical protein
MSSHVVTAFLYIGIGLVAVAVEVVARRRRASHRPWIPPLSHVFATIKRSPTGKVGLVVAWAWLGLHFFAR